MDTLSWSWVYARRGCVKGLVIGLAFGLIWGLKGWNPGSVAGLVLAMAFGLLGALLGGPIGSLFGGLRRGIIDVKATPNLGIKLSMRNAALAGVVALLLSGLIGGLVNGPIDWLIATLIVVPLVFTLTARQLSTYDLDLNHALSAGLNFGLLFGLIAFFWYGGQDFIQHQVLRFILYWKNHAPLRYVKFLDYAARLVLLQKVGGGYIFIHRLLLEHFAAMTNEGHHRSSTT